MQGLIRPAIFCCVEILLTFYWEIWYLASVCDEVVDQVAWYEAIAVPCKLIPHIRNPSEVLLKSMSANFSDELIPFHLFVMLEGSYAA